MEFEEKQKLELWWLYILVGLETIVVGSILFLDKGGMSYEKLKELYFAPILGILLPYIVVYFVTQNSLTLKVDLHGVTYRYWPFSKQRTISWTQINHLYLRKYDALGEYGGWGVKHRLWFKFNDKAYIFNDNNVGLQIALNSGKKVLFSTKKPDELNLFLINLKRTHNIEAIETDVRQR
ncbi:MAG: hypothetical protein EOO07_15620 [Chitinophagaceae bacterium]|nr:MAG: hypothetical protein EOO07_15620 [Chitinophagaceae bacterium]